VTRDGETGLLIRPVERIYGINEHENDLIESVLDETYARCLYCFQSIRDPYYSTDEICPYHLGQYLTFLYFLGNTLFRRYNPSDSENLDVQDLCDKIFMTSLTISSADIYYKHNMPEIFLPAHPLGAVFTGKAKIGNYFFFMQGCNLGINNGKGPILGEGVVMWGDSKIVGDCHVGNHVMFAANSYIKDMDIPDNSIVFGQFPNVVVKENQEDKIMEVLNERFFMKG